MHILHKWKRVYTKETKEFLGVKYQADKKTKLRYCAVCGKVQKASVVWVTLKGIEKDIFDRKLKDSSVYTKG